MAVLQWRDELSVGVPAIDRDHQRLIDTLNRLRRLDGVSDETVIASALNEVVQYTQGHFRREEMLMRLSGYPGYQAHVRLHQQMAARAVELENRFRAAPKQLPHRQLLQRAVRLAGAARAARRRQAEALRRKAGKSPGRLTVDDFGRRTAPAVAASRA